MEREPPGGLNSIKLKLEHRGISAVSQQRICTHVELTLTSHVLCSAHSHRWLVNKKLEEMWSSLQEGKEISCSSLNQREKS